MSIRSRRNSLLKSSISIKSMRDTVSNFTSGITKAKKTAAELVKKTRESNLFKKRLGSFFKRLGNLIFFPRLRYKKYILI